MIFYNRSSNEFQVAMQQAITEGHDAGSGGSWQRVREILNMNKHSGKGWLLIDDIRTLDVDVICRTAEEGKEALESKMFEHLCLDHDLGENQENGYQVLTWALERQLVPKHVQLVTSNPVGRKNMTEALQQADYLTKDGINFFHVGD